MKRSYLLLLFVIVVFTLAAMDIPYSDQAVMNNSNLIDEFVRIDPDDRQPETLDTKVWVWQEKGKLMIHFSCVIDENFQVGSLVRRDNGSRADYLRVQLITMPSANFAYLFGAYPQGHLVDGIRQADMDVNYQWDSDYTYESTYNDSLWKVTFCIPLGSLRFKQELPYTWGLILSRDHQTSEDFFSSPYANTDSKLDYFKQAHRIVLHEKVNREFGLKIKPYFVKSYDLVNKTDSFDPEMLGLDIALNPGQQTKVKLSLNPDFSDVPPDNAQDIYNMETPVMYSENRFFFVEDLDAFGLDSSVFYTRNIYKPSFAFKLTGNTGSTKWGILGAKDEKIMDGNQVQNYDDYYQVLSIIPSFSIFTLGNALISRINQGYYNHVYFGNYDVKLGKDLMLNTEVTGSITKYDGEDNKELLKGYMIHGDLNFSPGNFDNYIRYNKVSRDIFLDAGYLYYKDYQSYGLSMDWKSDPGYGFIKNKQGYFNLNFIDWYNGGNTYNESSVYGNVGIDFKPNLNFSLNTTTGSIFDKVWNKHYIFGLRSSITRDKEAWARITLAISYADDLVYTLNDTFEKLGFELYVSGDIAKKYAYTISWLLNDYSYPRNNVIDNGQGPVNVQLDDCYSVINASLRFNPNLKLGLTGGLSYTNYTVPGSYADLQFYGNLQYEFKRDYFLYAGIKSSQYQDDKSTFSDPLGHYLKNSATAYVKLAITL